MGQCQSRGKLLRNFQGHWSIQISLERKAPRDWSKQTRLKFIRTNGAQIFLKVLVSTGVGP